LAKNHICLLLFSAGTPMILGGDEFLRSQRGNNNAYCQDNEISWFNWDDSSQNKDIFSFFQKAIALTRRYTILQRRKFFLGADLDADEILDLTWFGTQLDSPAWHDPELRTVCYQLDGGEEQSAGGDYLLFLIFNADHRLQPVRLPPLRGNLHWFRVIDTSLPAGLDFLGTGEEARLDPADSYLVSPRSTVVLVGK